MENKKSPLRNPEQRKTSLFFTGLIFSLSFTLVAFEWRTSETDQYVAVQWTGDFIEEEIIPVSRMKQPEPPPPPPVQHHHFQLVEELPVAAEPVVDLNLDIPDVPVVRHIEAPTEHIAELPVRLEATEMPAFVGGETEMYKYLQRNVSFPSMAREANISGAVYVTFVVDTNGIITNAEVLRGIGGGCDEEALRVIRNMPAWKPGKQNGDPVRVRFNMPIRFTLKK